MAICSLLLLGVMMSYHLQAAMGEMLPVVTCTGPGNTGCSVVSTYGVWGDRKDCKVAKVVYPKTEQELVAAVAEGVRNGQTMKAVSRGSHSIPKLVCPGRNGTGLLISTRDYNKNIFVDKTAQTATLDAGVRLKVFFDTIARQNLAFPHSPYWAGLSIAGVLGTGAHGSSTWGKGSCIYDYVTAIRLVVPASAAEGYAKVLNLVAGVDDELLNAARVSLGVLGVISTVTLELQPQFKRQYTSVKRSDADLEYQIVQNAQQNEFGGVSWFPSLKTAFYRVDNRVSVNVPGRGTNNFSGFVPQSNIVLATTRALETLDEVVGNAGNKCDRSEAQLNLLALVGNGYTNDGIFFKSYPIVGFQNSIQTSGTCDTTDLSGFQCAWDTRSKGVFFFQTTFSVSFTRIAAFIADVKALVALNPDCLCGVGLYDGILMRYVKRSSGAYLGEQEDSVNMDFTYYRSYDPKTPRLFEDTLEEIEQMMMFKYGGKPHWGKNRPVGFATTPKLFPDLPKFLEIKNNLDPLGLFSSEWTDKILNVSGAAATLQNFKPFCALEGLCICTEHIHCAPDEGYFCRPGLVYKQARVCRREIVQSMSM